uniref:DUS-like FMN-binding domain-containing protein n=1 Tax=Fagus sylvatica TaxID=28930 RepID=A0A2N9I7Y2_FAGSY
MLFSEPVTKKETGWYFRLALLMQSELSLLRKWCKDVAAVDINMGCPKSFSISGGMGAALLTKPELIHDILTTLKRNLEIPVTCKIRLLKSSQDTVELARRIEKTGVSALAVHGRKVPDRPRDPAKWSEIADVVAALSIPVIANGDVFEYDDFRRIKDTTERERSAYGPCKKSSTFKQQERSCVISIGFYEVCLFYDHEMFVTVHQENVQSHWHKEDACMMERCKYKGWHSLHGQQLGETF